MVVNRKKAGGLMTAGFEIIWCLRLAFLLGGHVSFTTGRDIFAPLVGHDAAHARSFVSVVNMHGEKIMSLAKAAFVLLGFVFGNSQTNKCASGAACSRANRHARKRSQNRACRDEGADSRNRQRADACGPAERSS